MARNPVRIASSVRAWVRSSFHAVPYMNAGTGAGGRAVTAPLSHESAAPPPDGPLRPARSAEHPVAAVGADRLPGHVGGVGGGEEHHHAGDLWRRPEAA